MLATDPLHVLVATAAFIGCAHTLLGPDHYVPFVAMSPAGRWSMRKTAVVTLLCGAGHVAGSIVLGALGIGLGWVIGNLEQLERIRGDLAAWLLLGFGLAYMTWGIRRAIRNRPHAHWHAHADGTVHRHSHTHDGGHVHAHAADGDAGAVKLTPWVLFTVFVLGPCEPLIPILMYPAAQSAWWAVAVVAGVFAAATLATMLAVVMTLCMGIERIPLAGLGRYSHALAGLSLAACGAAIQFGL
jgi:ABC-type nickel/cobalt efflux system permease component RcnA